MVYVLLVRCGEDGLPLFCVDGQLNRVDFRRQFLVEPIDRAGDDVFLVEILLVDVRVVQES